MMNQTLFKIRLGDKGKREDSFPYNRRENSVVRKQDN